MHPNGIAGMSSAVKWTMIIGDMNRILRKKSVGRRTRPSPHHLVNAAMEAGAWAAKVIDPSTVETAL